MLWLPDTNILVSAALFPGSVPARALAKAFGWPHSAVICDYSLEEMRMVYNRKFPHKLNVFERFLSLLEISVEIIPTPRVQECDGLIPEIRDRKDLPILLAALSVNANGILTGDKDFLESGIQTPQMLSPAQFLHLY